MFENMFENIIDITRKRNFRRYFTQIENRSKIRKIIGNSKPFLFLYKQGKKYS